MSRGYLTNQEYPFSNIKKKNLVAIPVGDTRKDHYLNVQQMTELYRVFIEKRYPEKWKKGRVEGLKLRGGKTLKLLEWDNGEVVNSIIE